MPVVLVDQLDVDQRRALAGRGQLARQHRPLVAEEVGLAHVEDEVDRALRDDGGQERRFGDQVADVDPAIGDPPADRRRDLGVLEIELGLLDGRLRRADGRFGGLALLQPLVVVGLGERRAADQLGDALELELGELELRLGAREIGLGALQRGLERPRVDQEQVLALLDGLAVLEVDGREIARDPGANLDLLVGLEAAGELGPLDQLLDPRMGDGDLGRRRRRRGIAVAVAAAVAAGKRQPAEQRQASTGRATGPVACRTRARRIPSLPAPCPSGRRVGEPRLVPPAGPQQLR